MEKCMKGNLQKETERKEIYKRKEKERKCMKGKKNRLSLPDSIYIIYIYLIYL